MEEGMDFVSVHLEDTPAAPAPMHEADINLQNLIVPAAQGAADAVQVSPATIMKRNLAGLFCEADPEARARIFEQLWHSNAGICEQDDARAGRSAVLEIAARFSERMAGLTCSAMSPVSGSDDIYMLRWVAHRDGSPVATGCHMGLLIDDRIHSFYMVED